MKAEPLVSCVCPTADRQQYIPQMLDSFFSQTWQNKELIILDDGKPCGNLVPQHPQVNYIHLPKKLNIPTKRNLLAKMAQGEFICHFDDDDWSAPGRIAAQVKHMRQYQVGIVGFHSILFWNELTGEVWRYQGAKGYACGTSFFYRKAFWKRNRFPETQDLGSDNSVIYPARANQQSATFDGGQLLVARIHEDQSNFKDLRGRNYGKMQLSSLPLGFPQT